MVAQDHRLALAEIAHQPLLLIEVDRDAFVTVVGDIAALISSHSWPKALIRKWWPDPGTRAEMCV